MKLSDAAHILSLTGTVGTEDIKLAYRRAAKKYHPDRNPAGLEMMKMVNEAYELLKEYSGNLEDEGATVEGTEYTGALSEALNLIINLEGLIIEVCGAWVWVGGETYPHRKILNDANFTYAGKKKRWYFRPDDWKSSSRGSFEMDDIRENFGSNRPVAKAQAAIAQL